MAESIKNQVDALTGFASTEDLALQDWCEAGVVEIINQLPMKLKEKCMTVTPLVNGSGIDLDGFGEVLFVQRETGDSTTIYAPCRKIPSMYGGMAGDSTNLLYFGTATDPVYWVDGTGDVSKLYVKPDPTSNSDAKIFHVSHPQVNLASSEIGNFPDEANYLVVLYAAIRATERLMLDQEDAEVYAPQLATLKQDYAQGIAALKGGQ